MSRTILSLAALQRRPMLRCSLLLLALWPGFALAEVGVVTTNPSLADLTRQVGGEQVRVESLMRGPENPHNVIPKPSFVMKLRKADLFVHLGLDAEPWVPSLVRSARRERLLAGGEGNIDASRGIGLLEVPSRGELTRSSSSQWAGSALAFSTVVTTSKSLGASRLRRAAKAMIPTFADAAPMGT